jgi:pantoate kinase
VDVNYWVASHLTGIFEICDQSTDPLLQGSRGAGISINRGVSTKVSYSEIPEVQVFFNGEKISPQDALVTTKTIELLLLPQKREHFRIDHFFEVPLSAGYGASAAGALGCTFALNEYFNLELSEIEMFQLAHQTEVSLKTGLGDIIGLYQGGLELRSKAGAPGIGKTRELVIDEEWKVATLSRGPLSTTSVLTNPKKRDSVNSAGRCLISDLINSPKYSEFISKTEYFSQKVDLMSLELKNIASQVPDEIKTAQIMLGDSLFLFYQDKDVLESLLSSFPEIITEEICNQTVRRVDKNE